MELFSVQDLTFSYPGQTVPALERLSFDISAGEFLVIAGPSGCGKSTLLRQFKTARRINDLQHTEFPGYQIQYAVIQLHHRRFIPAVVFDIVTKCAFAPGTGKCL